MRVPGLHRLEFDEGRVVLTLAFGDADVDALADAWPMRVPGLHRLEFDEGRVVLTLAFGDAIDMLGKIVARADLDRFAASNDADLQSADVIRALSKIAGEHATERMSSDALKHALDKSGFTYREVDDLLVGEYAALARAPARAAALPLRRAVRS